MGIVLNFIAAQTQSTVGVLKTEPSNCNDNNSDTTRTLCGYELTQNLNFALKAY